MSHPEQRRPRRYRLNKKKFAAALFVIICIAALTVVAAMSLENAVAGMAEASVADAAGTSSHIQDGVIETGAAYTKPESDELDGRLIVVDAGHGGFDPGAIGVGGTYESGLNLAVAQYLKASLENCGARVIMTRDSDIGLGETQEESLAERRRIIEQSTADIVMSIHMNSYEDDEDICGPVVLFMPGSEQGKALAEAMQDSMNDALEADGIARSQSLYILKSGNMPCVLVECGYISNAAEEQMLKQTTYQQKVAQAICAGVKTYFQQT